jgi:hypothetical protein
VALIFPRWTNRAPLVIGLGGPLLTSAIVLGIWYWLSPKYTDVGYQPGQQVPFSHKLHAGDLGMDCRYCHNTVERAAYAAIPPTQTCMNCHHLILKSSPKLAPIRASFASGKPMEWIKVHMLPDYAYFDHSIHLAAGVGCRSCHGRVDQMKVVHQTRPMSMAWCLECHREPWPHLRPPDQVTNMKWDPKRSGYDPKNDASRPRQPDPPVHCSGCHR